MNDYEKIKAALIYLDDCAFMRTEPDKNTIEAILKGRVKTKLKLDPRDMFVPDVLR